MQLRPYQKDAVRAAVEWMEETPLPCVIEAPTGAGKSFIIASLADIAVDSSATWKVLVIAPRGELVSQNFEKYTSGTGAPASIFSSSLGEKDTSEPVIFSTPMSIKNSIDLISNQVSTIIIDECHRITPTIKSIVASVREHFPGVRVVGLTATPYRLGESVIYQIDERGHRTLYPVDMPPYFTRLVYKIEAGDLIDNGYLCPVVIGAPSEEGYDTSGLKKSRTGQFTGESIRQTYEGKERLTASLVREVVAISEREGRRGAILFAASVHHAYEILESLPEGSSDILTGGTPKGKRKNIVRRFKSGDIKYLVNVEVLALGFDAPHVDVVALLRRTESAALLQQMVGRGLRKLDGKRDCLVLDYAGNIEKLCHDGDIFDPRIVAGEDKKESKTAEIICPQCAGENKVVLRPTKDTKGLSMDEFGYLVDISGMRIAREVWGGEDVGTVYKPTPGHFTRRCQCHYVRGGELYQCDYRWSYKICRGCGGENDISARHCQGCNRELIDPNTKLKREYARRKKDPTLVQTDLVLTWEVDTEYVSRTNGNPTIRIDITTMPRESGGARRSFTCYFAYGEGVSDWVNNKHDAMEAKVGGWNRSKMSHPTTVTYRKKGMFWDLIDVDRPVDTLDRFLELEEAAS